MADDFVCKVTLVGEANVGKTSLLFQLVDGTFGQTQTTTGLDYKEKSVVINDEPATLQVWDTAGQERFRTMTSTYYRGAHAVVIVYDVTERSTFNDLKGWLDQIRRYGVENVVKILIGNKSDLDGQRQVQTSEGQAFAAANGLLFFETSAKSGANVAAAFDAVTANVKRVVAVRSDSMTRPGRAKAKPDKKKGFCSI
eukprot:TRINITY_DN1099_c0_g1_i1.p2 TRINITY_DN1099_c0_g1~~TRINITY_DN1099_c0_g1_i1.p2  ORF type:complete len:197 (+),score=90.69 TRINITY_DN1099_c0_g1_i1:108-698(+)